MDILKNSSTTLGTFCNDLVEEYLASDKGKHEEPYTILLATDIDLTAFGQKGQIQVTIVQGVGNDRQFI